MASLNCSEVADDLDGCKEQANVLRRDEPLSVHFESSELVEEALKGGDDLHVDDSEEGEQTDPHIDSVVDHNPLSKVLFPRPRPVDLVHPVHVPLQRLVVLLHHHLHLVRKVVPLQLSDELVHLLLHVDFPHHRFQRRDLLLLLLILESQFISFRNHLSGQSPSAGFQVAVLVSSSVPFDYVHVAVVLPGPPLEDAGPFIVFHLAFLITVRLYPPKLSDSKTTIQNHKNSLPFKNRK